MYKYHNGLLPSAFDSLFTNLGSSHTCSYNTSRNADNYRFEIKLQNKKCYIGWTQNMEQYTHNVPNEFKKCKFMNQFKKKMRKYLQNQICC